MDRTTSLVLGCVACVGLLAADRYSYGYPGGEAYLRAHTWQVFGAVLLAGLLFGVAVAGILKRWNLARTILILEMSTYALLNGIWLFRDGLGRFFWGYSHAAFGLLVVGCGLYLRRRIFNVCSGQGEFVVG